MNLKTGLNAFQAVQHASDTLFRKGRVVLAGHIQFAAGRVPVAQAQIDVGQGAAQLGVRRIAVDESFKGQQGLGIAPGAGGGQGQAVIDLVIVRLFAQQAHVELIGLLVAAFVDERFGLGAALVQSQMECGQRRRRCPQGKE